MSLLLLQGDIGIDVYDRFMYLTVDNEHLNLYMCVDGEVEKLSQMHASRDVSALDIEFLNDVQRGKFFELLGYAIMIWRDKYGK